MTAPQPTHPLLKGLLAGDRAAQQALFQQYAGKMLAVCRRYMGDKAAAEDVLMDGMLQVFSKISQYDGSGPLEAWIRRLMVNQALMALRKQQLFFVETESLPDDQVPSSTASHLQADELMGLIAKLPDGYRTVFNLYAIEGYSHAEIASQLGISEGTSKSQLSRARNMLQAWLAEEERALARQQATNY